MLYAWLKMCVSICFNALNKLLGGRLPPFGSAAIVVEHEGKFLAVELPRGQVVFPGGFMNWDEHPQETAIREGKEETGLDIEAGELVNVYPATTKSWHTMSTISFVYEGSIIGGRLRKNAEGRPVWLTEKELRRRMSPRTLRVLDDYLRQKRRGNIRMRAS